MAVLVDMTGSHDIGSATTSWNQEVQAAVPTADKGVHCTNPDSIQEATQTDLTSFRCAGCQTEAASPEAEVDIVKTGVSCERCHKFFFWRGSADRHWILRHTVEPPEGPQEPYYCPYCSFSSFTRRFVRLHERNHAEEEAYARRSSARCFTPRCTQRCPLKTSPVGDKTKPADDKSSTVCSFFKTHFSSECSGVDHKRLPSRKAPYPCQFCPQRFTRKSRCDRHERGHITRESNICDVCQKCFACKYRLDAHAVTHNEKRFKCDICKKCFFRKADMIRHTATHAKERLPFVCEVCEMRFLYKNSLVDHMKVHIAVGEKPYACIVCHEAFRQKAGLLDHQCLFLRRRMVAASVETTSLESLGNCQGVTSQELPQEHTLGVV